MSTATLSPAAGDFDDEFARITDAFEVEDRPRRFVKSRTEIMSAGEAINLSLGRRRHRTREREQ